MKTSHLPALLIIAGLFSVLFSACELMENLDPESETEKITRIFTSGSPWKLDTLNLKTDLFSGGNSVITSDTTFYNYGTIEFLDPAAEKNPGYNTGYLIHRYSENGSAKTDTMAWAPYNHNSGSDNHITIFFRNSPGADFVVGAWDMYLDKIVIEDKKLKFEGWRRETLPGGAGGSYGSFRSYSLSR